ncbi:DUF4097 family beta strand repeat-containing protein [uncultured Anaerococcus sp.]|uniref:DUF4097 family beta strand repeat-containing protein n=1 Tax=uncultured Anaerococcus sp. TaxID=293428 RepID=UPI002607DC7B|nr:DUF4097 family beta strand repeat-containing protein [uncultured Anaerococcus sp.]
MVDNNIKNDKKDNIDDEYDEELEEILNEPDSKFKRKFTRGNKNRNIIIAIIAVILIAALLYFINDRVNSNKGDSQSSKVIDENSYNGSNIMRVDLNEVSKINIDLKTADVRIQRSNTNPYIEYTKLYRGEDDVYTVDASYDNGELNLKSNIQGKELNMKNKVQIVRIFLPQDKPIDEIKATIGAGDVKISDLEVKNLDLNVSSGHITFENSFFGGNVSNEAGDIILEKSELLNSKLTTNAGDILITDSKLGSKSDFSTSTGNIIIKADDSIDNYNVKANLEVGNFILGNISYRNIKDGFNKNNKAKKDISLKTKVGDIIFNKGEGAILEEEEYITNESQREKSDTDSEDDQNNTEDEDNTEQEDDTEDQDNSESDADQTLEEDMKVEEEESGGRDSSSETEENTNN